jgi:prepilin-type N-terminal cleavage/methylation domain-containing protein
MNTNVRGANAVAAAGFSLIEVMFVSGLMAITSAIAVPMMSHSLGNFRLTGDARGIKNEIWLAKMQAAANFTRARLYVDPYQQLSHRNLAIDRHTSWVAQVSHVNWRRRRNHMVSAKYRAAAEREAITQLRPVGRGRGRDCEHGVHRLNFADSSRPDRCTPPPRIPFM